MNFYTYMLFFVGCLGVTATTRSMHQVRIANDQLANSPRVLKKQFARSTKERDEIVRHLKADIDLSKTRPDIVRFQNDMKSDIQLLDERCNRIDGILNRITQELNQ
jgi:hypothetical protein